MAFALGYNMAPMYNWDGLAWIYLSIAALWTLLLISGIIFLLTHRDLPSLRIRDIPLSVSAVLTLHVYWCLCMTAYILNGNFPCSIEYWIMSVYLPLGIALYQAGNTQLLYIAGLQKKFVYDGLLGTNEGAKGSNSRRWHKVEAKWHNLSTTKKTMTCVAAGILMQFLCALVVFLISRMFHPNFGIVGHPVDKMTCRKGWQWLPSIVWQFTWSWIYAPYLLWKLRDIQDIHCWRLQTIICSLAGMLGSPMWLIALYAPAMHSSINFYFPPPLWFAPSVSLMEASVVFMPCWQVFKNQKLKKETLRIIADWEQKQRTCASIGSDSTKAARASVISHKASLKSKVSAASSRRGEMYTMQALQKALATNPTPLLLFAALKDFSGENIGFLKEVRDWKAKWSPHNPRFPALRKPSNEYQESKAIRRQQYNLGVQIYSSFVSLQYSDFPVNLSSGHLKELEAMFDGAAALVSAHLPDDAVTPFNSYGLSNHNLDLEAAFCRDQMSLVPAITNTSTEEILLSPREKQIEGRGVKMSDLTTRLPSWVQVPDEFGPKSFDNAEESIKYMVLTNTWPKFVSAGYANSVQKESTWSKVKSAVSICPETYGQQLAKMSGK